MNIHAEKRVSALTDRTVIGFRIDEHLCCSLPQTVHAGKISTLLPLSKLKMSGNNFFTFFFFLCKLLIANFTLFFCQVSLKVADYCMW